MFYSKDCVERSFDILLKKLEEEKIFAFEPMPSYKEGGQWTDDNRISAGHAKLDDGSWVTIHKATTWVEKLKKATAELYEENQKAYREMELLKQQKYEMEFGLRVAQKHLNKALTMKGNGNEKLDA
jgi:hypothetical protein